MRRTAFVAVAIALLVAVAGYAHSEEGCGGIAATECGLVADTWQGNFHGLIAVKGQPDVLANAAHSGTAAGCGDCVWTLVLMCVANTPTDPHNQQPCVGAGQSPKCRPGQTAFRLYLTTAAVTNELVQTLCLGGIDDVIPVGDIAAADVARYIKDVTPPAVVLRTQPPREAIAGLPAYFIVRPPVDLRPTRLDSSNQDIVETITIAPLHYAWSWGDDTADLETDDAGAPYPDGHVTHTYASGGRVRGSVTMQWGATYMITTEGQTFGPYDATGGVVPLTQIFTLPVATAHSHLVSHRAAARPDQRRAPRPLAAPGRSSGAPAPRPARRAARGRR